MPFHLLVGQELWLMINLPITYSIVCFVQLVVQNLKKANPYTKWQDKEYSENSFYILQKKT